MPSATPGSRYPVNVSYFFHIAVFLCITFLFGKIEPVEPLTPYGMNVIGVFMGVIYAWVFIDIIWPSMVGLLALITLDVMPAQELLNKGFGDPVVVMMMFIFVFSAAIDHYGLSKFISRWFVSRKCVAHRPWMLTFTLLASVSLLGGLTSATPAAVIGWSLLYGIFDLCGYQKKDGYPIMMIIGTVYAAQLGMSLVPFKSIPFVAISAYEKLSGVPIDYTSYMLVAITGCFLCLLLFILLGKFLFRPDVSRLVSLDINALITNEDMKLSGIQKLLLVFLLALIIFMMIPGFLPKDLAVTVFFKKMGSTGVCILLVAIMCAIRIKGKTLLPFRSMVNEGVAWPIIFILAFTLPLAGPLSDPKSGITGFMLDMLQPLFHSDSSLLFILCMGGVAVIMTQFINNTALVVALMPIVYAYCSTKNVAAEMPVILITIAGCLAFLTPAASSTAAMLHGNDWVTTRNIWKISPILIALSLLIVGMVIIVFGTLFFSTVLERP